MATNEREHLLNQATVIEDGDFLRIVKDLAGTPLSQVADPGLLAEPAFEAVQTAGNPTSCATGINTVVKCDSELIDTGGYYNPTTGRFQPGVAGTYWIDGCCVMKDMAADKEVWVGIRKNGSSSQIRWIFIGDSSFTNADVGGSGGKKVYFNGTTDYAEMIVYHNHGSARDTYDTGSNVVSFGGYRISPANIAGW